MSRSFNTRVYELEKGRYLLRFVPLLSELQILKKNWLGQYLPVIYLDSREVKLMLEEES